MPGKSKSENSLKLIINSEIHVAKKIPGKYPVKTGIMGGACRIN
jgi:hypothetical protein